MFQISCSAGGKRKNRGAIAELEIPIVYRTRGLTFSCDFLFLAKSESTNEAYFLLLIIQNIKNYVSKFFLYLLFMIAIIGKISAATTPITIKLGRFVSLRKETQPKTSRNFLIKGSSDFQKSSNVHFGKAT